MPLLGLISGYLYQIKNKKFCSILIGKIRSLVIPIICWVTIEFVMLYLCGRYRGNDTLNIFKAYISKVVFSYWFLWAVFLASIIVFVVEKYCKGSSLVYGLIVIFSLLIPTKLNVHLYTYIFPYYFIGHIIRSKGHDIESFSKKKIQKIDVVFISAFLILLSGFQKVHYIYNSCISIIDSENWIIQLGIDMYRWGIGLVGCYVCVRILFVLYNVLPYRLPVKIISYLGKISIGIYIGNCLYNVYILIPFASNFSYNLLLTTIESLLSIIICVILYQIIDKNCILKVYLFGGR